MARACAVSFLDLRATHVHAASDARARAENPSQLKTDKCPNAQRARPGRRCRRRRRVLPPAPGARARAGTADPQYRVWALGCSAEKRARGRRCRAGPGRQARRRGAPRFGPVGGRGGGAPPRLRRASSSPDAQCRLQQRLRRHRRSRATAAGSSPRKPDLVAVALGRRTAHTACGRLPRRARRDRLKPPPTARRRGARRAPRAEQRGRRPPPRRRRRRRRAATRRRRGRGWPTRSSRARRRASPVGPPRAAALRDQLKRGGGPRARTRDRGRSRT